MSTVFILGIFIARKWIIHAVRLSQLVQSNVLCYAVLWGAVPWNVTAMAECTVYLCYSAVG